MEQYLAQEHARVAMVKVAEHEDLIKRLDVLVKLNVLSLDVPDPPCCRASVWDSYVDRTSLHRCYFPKQCATTMGFLRWE